MPVTFLDSAAASGALPVFAVAQGEAEPFLARQPQRHQTWLRAQGWHGQAGRILLLPGESGAPEGAVIGLGTGEDRFAIAALATALPAGTWHIAQAPASLQPDHIAFALAIGAYAFKRYKADAKKEAPSFVWPEGADRADVTRIVEGVTLARDLVNMPASDMGPEELSRAAQTLAEAHGARFSVIVGDDLLAQNYPMVHAVGRASARSPRLARFAWGDERHPRLALVGKGVCFDSGGLDIKTAAAMATMKKDMGGAACVLGLAHMIMDAQLPVRLDVLVPAVENAISCTAFRPGDVLPSRKGLTVEIGNTDAEGRLILADALAEADAAKPDLLVDIATLTGAARVATGFELPPFFTDDEDLASALMRHAAAEQDPMWRLPLWKGYESWIEGKVANLTNSADSAYAGAITAALFLRRFTAEARSWVHFDIAAWTDKPKPGRPAGAEAHVIRALYALVRERYAR